MIFDHVMDAAECLGRFNDVVKLTKLKELVDNQKFYITVWGHYSAGKSKLINNILQRDILPVQTRETTAVLTYIQYGTNEECVVVYDDGTITTHDLGVLKNIFQNTEESVNVGNIDHIEVYLENGLLKTGLILVDTPGVNTIIQKHQNIAVDAIEQSGRIIYVLGNAPTNTDREFIQRIAACGVWISFVRTKCDRFNTTEESIDDTLKTERRELFSFVERETEFIPVSNEKDNKWFENIEKVRELLYEISLDISQQMKVACEERLSKFADVFLEELRAEKQHLNDIMKGDTQKYDSQISEFEKQIKLLESLEEDIESKVEAKVKQAQKQSQKELDVFITKQTENFTKLLECIEFSANANEDVKELYDKCISSSVEKIQRLLNSYFDNIIREENKELLGNISEDDLSIQAPTYAEVQQENSRMLELCKTRLAETKSKIEAILKESEENERTAEEIETGFDESSYAELLDSLNQELAEIPSGMALRLVENQNIQPSKVFKGIGDAVDMVLLLLPGDVIFKGVKTAANTKKVAQVMHKLGKIGDAITKAANTVGKNAKLIDTVRDTAYAVNTILGKRAYSSRAEKQKAELLVDKVAMKAQNTYDSFKEDKRNGNVLDALSVAYWTEKFGEKFDTPPKMEIDIEEEQRRNQLRKKITDQQQQISEERIQKKRELGLLQNRQKELEVLAQEEERKKERIEEEIRKQEGLEREQARKNAFNRFCKEYKVYFNESITKIAQKISAQYFKVANQNLTMYISNQTANVMDEIQEKREQMSKLLGLKDTGNDEMEKKLNEYNRCIENLEMV